jgi:prophage DNA circulation protein
MPAWESLLDSVFPASFRGVPFWITDTTREVGRRWQRLFFPGADASAWEDLGLFQGAITCQGLVIGDDYIGQLQDLEAAFATPGPGTLVHPRLGTLEVVLADPATTSIAEDELRVGRFSASFTPYTPPALAEQDPLSAALAAVRQLRNQVTAYLGQVLAPVRLAVGAVYAVASFGAQVGSVLGTLVATAKGGIGLLPVLAAPIKNLSSIGSLPASATFAPAVASALAAPPAAIALAAVTPRAGALGVPAGATALIEPRVAARLLLDLATGMPAGPAGVVIAARALALASAAEVIGTITFESQHDAAGWLGKADAAIAATMQAAVLAGPQAGQVWQAMAGLRAALARDLQSLMGRLPAVTTLTVPAATQAWVVANHLAGDTPATIIGQYRDLVARNRLRQPAQISAGAVLERLA